MDSFQYKKFKFLLSHPLYYRKLQKLRRTNQQYSIVPYLKTRSIFVHIPKAAGVSLSTSLYGNYGGGHCSISDYRYIFSEAEFESFFKFSIVRNPWDRLWSAYRFLQSGGFSEKDRKWSDANMAGFPDFETFVMEWLNEKNIYAYPHFIPQHAFITLPETSSLAIDFLGYYENLNDDFYHISSKLGLNASLTYENKTKASKEIPFTDIYNQDMIDKVEQVYCRDVELLKYEFSNSGLQKQIERRNQRYLSNMKS